MAMLTSPQPVEAFIHLQPRLLSPVAERGDVALVAERSRRGCVQLEVDECCDLHFVLRAAMLRSRLVYVVYDAAWGESLRTTRPEAGTAPVSPCPAYRSSSSHNSDECAVHTLFDSQQHSHVAAGNTRATTACRTG
ncbi:hypothetical protein F441_01796 [Phytophthora nicotianae CJ01A1]|uniref:Uncharacterized protein n=2 Tax=Phytophthora nicotianae TaxID=4792 RepID=W2XS14_PHYNI|nr:hypothetical protein F444_01840 [Phytophthora nicotianae P1976]ETP25287.1 hypothetical protein F441_01796 [Phytophthora nicotianae CJ01A1]